MIILQPSESRKSISSFEMSDASSTTSKLSPESKEEFIVRVCALKKELRRKYIGGYRVYEGVVSKNDYKKYGVPFSEELALKRCAFTGSDGKKHYRFQVNGIHSPDDIVAYNREIKVLQEYGAFNDPM